MGKISTYYFYLFFLFMLTKRQEIFAQNLQSLKGQKPFSISGSLSATAQFYAVNGIENRRQPFTWYLTGSPTIKIYGISMPFSFTVSEQERNFSQPFNRYGVSPTYKWIKLHLGYRNVRFSDFTLGGANFLGGGIELTPKKLRFAFVYGEFKRRVFEDSSSQDPRYRYLRPTYQRLGYGGKIGYGKTKGYIDFSFFKAEDVATSIYKPSLRSGIKPMQNLSIGTKSHLSFLKTKLAIDFDLGLSVLTRDTRKFDLETTDVWLQRVLKIMPINSTTSVFTALRGGTSYRAKKGNARLDYQRISPDFQSLGAYFFQNDIEQITFSPSAQFLKGKITLNASAGLSHDNLNKKKAATTNRKVGSANLSIRPSQHFNAALSYSNFGVGESRGLADLFNDSLAVSVVNSSYSGNMNYIFGGTSQRQSIGMNITMQRTNDFSQFSSNVMGTSSLMSSVNYSLSIPSQKLTTTGSVAYVKLSTAGRNMQNIGPSFSASKTWKNGKYRTNMNHNSQLRKTNGLNDGIMSNTGLNASALIHKKQTLNIGLNYLYNQYKTQSDGLNFRNFSEYRVSITYGIRF